MNAGMAGGADATSPGGCCGTEAGREAEDAVAGPRSRVLVADEAAGVRAVVSRALRAAGYAAVEAGDGAEALGLIGHMAGIGLVVTDIDMLGFGGVDVATSARARDPAVPILFITERTDAVTDRVTAPPCYCLSKPFTAAVLVEVADRLLAPRPAATSTRPEMVD